MKSLDIEFPFIQHSTVKDKEAGAIKVKYSLPARIVPSESLSLIELTNLMYLKSVRQKNLKVSFHKGLFLNPSSSLPSQSMPMYTLVEFK